MNRVFLVRHGENPANITKELSSRHVDYSLTEKGRMQARQTGHFFASQLYRIDEIYASPLKRAHETALLIAEPFGLSVTVMDNFREVDVGRLEDPPISMAKWEVHNQIVDQWMTGNPEAIFPEGDNYHTLWGRFRAGLIEVLRGKNNRNLVIVGHGGIFCFTLKDLCPGVNLSEVFSIGNANCSVSEFSMQVIGDELQANLIRWADHSHLDGEAAVLVNPVPQEGELD